MSEHEKKFQLRLSAQLMRRLKAAARRRGVTASVLIRTFVESLP